MSLRCLFAACVWTLTAGLLERVGGILPIDPPGTGFCDNPLNLPTFLDGSFFHDWSCSDIVNSMGTRTNNQTNAMPYTPPTTIAIQDSWDWRTHSPSNCNTGVRNQGKCGSCWSMSSTSAFAHRFCIAGHDQGFGPVVLSPQQKLFCDKTCYSGSTSACNQGCGGGYVDLAWQDFQTNGVVSETCIPYQGDDGSCPSSCSANGVNYTLFQAQNFYSLNSIASIQRDLQSYGPSVAAIQVYADFLNYNGGVYVYDGSSKAVGGHAVKMMGWGTAGGVDYWIVENSWGTSWGENGYARIRKGTNEIQIESNVFAGVPQIAGLVYNDDFGHNTAFARNAPIVLVSLVAVVTLLYSSC